MRKISQVILTYRFEECKCIIQLKSLWPTLKLKIMVRKNSIKLLSEVVESLWDFLKDHPDYVHAKILERITEPEREY